jgi:hypothetical protein
MFAAQRYAAGVDVVLLMLGLGALCAGFLAVLVEVSR